MIDESTLKPLDDRQAQRPQCRYCLHPIVRSETTGLWYCDGCGMYQTVPRDPELIRC